MIDHWKLQTLSSQIPSPFLGFEEGVQELATKFGLILVLHGFVPLLVEFFHQLADRVGCDYTNPLD
jgi:hypothetical protein